MFHKHKNKLIHVRYKHHIIDGVIQNYESSYDMLQIIFYLVTLLLQNIINIIYMQSI